MVKSKLEIFKETLVRAQELRRDVVLYVGNNSFCGSVRFISDSTVTIKDKDVDHDIDLEAVTVISASN